MIYSGGDENSCESKTKNKAFEWEGCIITFSPWYIVSQTQIISTTALWFLIQFSTYSFYDQIITLVWKCSVVAKTLKQAHISWHSFVITDCSWVLSNLHFHVPSQKTYRIYFYNFFVEGLYGRQSHTQPTVNRPPETSKDVIKHHVRAFICFVTFIKGGSLTNSDSWWTKHTFEGSASIPTCHLHLGEKGLLFSKYKAQNPAKQFHQGSKGISTVNHLKAVCVRDVTSGAAASCVAPVRSTTQAARTSQPNPHWPQHLLWMIPPRVPSLCSERAYQRHTVTHLRLGVKHFNRFTVHCMNSSLWLPHKLKPITDQYDQINVFMQTHSPTGNDKISQNDGDV